MRAKTATARGRWLILCLSLSFLLGGCGLLGHPPDARKALGAEIAAKRAFIARNPGHPRSKRFLRELDDPDFEGASRAHTLRAYGAYLAHHPSGKHVRRARYRAERLMYEAARASKDPRALERFRGRRFASPAEARLQRRAYEALRQRSDVASYRAFVARHKDARSEWTEAATQRLERLLLDAAKAAPPPRVLKLERYIFDNPGSPYLPEARDALRTAKFERAMRSGREVDWKAFIRRYEGSREAGILRRHMEAEALRGAERSGRVAALERYLERYPHSSHRKRILASIATMVRERNRQAGRWVRVRGAEVEVAKKRNCKNPCKPYLRVHGTLRNMDPDFSFSVVVQVELIAGGGRRCCRTRRSVRRIRPGESRSFSFPVRAEKPPREGSSPPRYELRVVSGSAYRSAQAEREVRIEGLGGVGEGPPSDRFAPVRVPDLPGN